MHATIVKRTAADRRKDRRFPIIGAIELRATGIDMPMQANLEDISAGGCRVNMRVPLKMKHPIRVALPQPGAEPLLVTGNVVRAYGSSADRVFHYGVRFRVDSSDLRSALGRYLSLYCQTVRPAGDRRAAAAVGGSADVKLPIEISVPGSSRFFATAITLSTSGMRIASTHVLRQEWTIKCDVKLKTDPFTPPAIVTLTAHALPGARTVRGQIVQDVEFTEPTLAARGEIERYIREMQMRGRRA